MASGPSEDVDRLFECFKCGVTPPLSAIKERKKVCREKLKDEGAKDKAPETICFGSSSLSKLQKHNEEGLAQLCTKKLDVSSLKAIKLNSGKQFSPIVFYGSPHGAPRKKPSQLLRLLHEIHVDLTGENELNQRKEVWATFPKQDEAVRFAKTHAKVHVFSFQDHCNGQRRFLVCTCEEFWRRYKNMNPKFRHHYEVIREGFPCHLYFDLEFNKKANPERNGAEMVEVLLSVIFEFLHEKYFIQGSYDWVVELDSSTEEKFSRHLTIRLPGTAFKDNSHAGAFVQELCSRVCRKRMHDQRLEKLYISKDSNSPPCQLFLDTAVYSRNRCFRVAFSSKAGKSSVLLHTGRFKCKKLSEEQIFMESLICRMDVDCKRLLICKMDLDCKKTLCFDSEVNSGCQLNPKCFQELALQTITNNLPEKCFSGKSPFPALDLFVESIASIGEVSGRIRCWYWFSDYGLMVYSMSRNRYCERIGREHKSNHVMYIVDFRRAGYYQKCYDPDCRGYRSPFRPLPRDTIPNSMDLMGSTWMINGTDKMGINLNIDLGDRNVQYNYYKFDEDITDSCKKDFGWWVEAIRIADDIERGTKVPNFNELGMGHAGDDYEWWIEVEKATSQLEDHAGNPV